MKKAIIPAIIAKNQEELDSIFSIIGKTAPIVQLDIMDGKFVPNTSLDFNMTLPEETYLYEAHLMVNDPAQWVEDHGYKVDTVIAHMESVMNPDEIIQTY